MFERERWAAWEKQEILDSNSKVEWWFVVVDKQHYFIPVNVENYKHHVTLAEKIHILESILQNCQKNMCLTFHPQTGYHFGVAV